MKIVWRTLIFAGVCIVAGASAFAQLSAPLSSGVSGPLDQNLNGLDSEVSPIPSTEVVPGANNLMNGDEHTLPFDSVGASVFSTTMNPFTTTSTVVSNAQSQVDGLLKDSTHLTSGSSLLSSGRSSTGILGSKSTPFAASSPSSLPAAKLTISASIFSISTKAAKENSGERGEKVQGLSLPMSNGSNLSSTRVNRANATSTVEDTNSGSASDRDSDTGKGSTAKKRRAGTIHTANRESSGDQTSPDQQPRDFSISPLEQTQRYGDQDQSSSSSKDKGHFRSLATSSFLSPDIFSSTLQPRQATTNQNQLSNEQKLYGMHDLSSSQLRAAMRKQKRTGGVKDTSSQLGGIGQLSQTRSQRRLQRQQRPKWHNPILQQMENSDSQD